jgi:hypothetical protein
MIAIGTRVEVFPHHVFGKVIARERPKAGGIVYWIRLDDGRVRPFGNACVSVAVEHAATELAVVRLPFRPRLVVNNGERL